MRSWTREAINILSNLISSFSIISCNKKSYFHKIFAENFVKTYIQTSFGTIISDQEDRGGLHASSDKGVDVIMPQLPQHSHFLHYVPRYVLFTRKLELFYANYDPSVLGGRSEYLQATPRFIRCYTCTCQTELQNCCMVEN